MCKPWMVLLESESESETSTVANTSTTTANTTTNSIGSVNADMLGNDISFNSIINIVLFQPTHTTTTSTSDELASFSRMGLVECKRFHQHLATSTATDIDTGTGTGSGTDTGSERYNRRVMIGQPVQLYTNHTSTNSGCGNGTEMELCVVRFALSAEMIIEGVLGSVDKVFSEDVAAIESMLRLLKYWKNIGV